MKKLRFPIVLATAYLLVYIVLLHAPVHLAAPMVMLVFSPFIILGLAYVILKYGKYHGKEGFDTHHE